MGTRTGIAAGIGVVSALAVLVAVLAFASDDGSEEGSGTSSLPPVRSTVPDTRFATLGGEGPLIGLADNRPETLVDPRFRATGIKRVRVLVPYDDVAGGGERRAFHDAWFKFARASGIEPLVSFYRSYRSKDLLPTPEEFRHHFRLFRARYPWVRLFSTWNEANFTSVQPTARDPARTARFYRVLRDECSRGRCTVLAADFLANGREDSARWLREFKRHIGPGPHRWGLVAHPDVNRFSTERTRWFLDQVEGPVWVTEVGALLFFGRGFPPSLTRQTKAMHYLVTRYPRVSDRIERMYVYHWRAAPGNLVFDSALLSIDGGPRPAYFEFFRALGKPAP
jgi:hypothetical protein